MGELFILTEAEVRASAEAMKKKAAVSRSHSSEEAFVMKVERRAESLKQESISSE